MVARCTNNRRKEWPRYGGRGVRVCERWLESFGAFLADVGLRPSTKHSLDRIDNDGNYEPGNCRWATATAQHRNRRDNYRITYRGQTYTRDEWSERTGIHRDTLRGRLRRGWTVEAALTRPVMNSYRR